MALKDQIVLLLTHPLEFRTLLQFWMYHHKNREITEEREWPTSGWDRPTMRRSWELLDMTSRSFAAVVKELEGELARTVCLFYLVLRGLDTIEDDMTIPDNVKQPILRSFHEKTLERGWTFDGCGPDEKDRQLLVEYDNVVDELHRLEPSSRDVIIDICQKMETGMADYAHRHASTGSIYLEKTADYDLYCHYVAGLVGEGVSRLFSATGKEAPWVSEQLELSNHMGLLLQKTNIIRDFREDCDDHRYFWPREIWGTAQTGFTEMAQMHAPGAEQRALWVLSAMVVDALRHAPDALDYLRMLRNQTVFNFCAIPQVMGLATLNLVFMNPAVFQRNVKIRKAEAAELIMGATNPRDVAYMFRDYARKIHAKASPLDPNFIQLCAACSKIEQWCERQYPSFVKMSVTDGKAQTTLDPTDARHVIIELEQKREKELALVAKGVNPALINRPVDPDAGSDAAKLVGTIVVVMIVVCLGLAFAVIKIADWYFPPQTGLIVQAE